jgi:predicted Zn-dependent protease
VDRAAPAEPDVYLVGLDEFPGEMLIRLEAFFEGKYGVRVGVLASVDIPADAYDGGQLVAALVSDPIQAARVDDRPVIALTEEDLVIQKRTVAVFSARSSSRSLAVVSVARMDPVNLGLQRNDELLFMRMAKIVAKDIGVLHLGLPLSNDPRSVMYDPINSLAALDAVADDFVLDAR